LREQDSAFCNNGVMIRKDINGSVQSNPAFNGWSLTFEPTLNKVAEKTPELTRRVVSG